MFCPDNVIIPQPHLIPVLKVIHVSWPSPCHQSSVASASHVSLWMWIISQIRHCNQELCFADQIWLVFEQCKLVDLTNDVNIRFCLCFYTFMSFWDKKSQQHWINDKRVWSVVSEALIQEERLFECWMKNRFLLVIYSTEKYISILNSKILLQYKILSQSTKAKEWKKQFWLVYCKT